MASKVEHDDGGILLHDSMVTVRLSEPPALTVDTSGLSNQTPIPIPIPIQEEFEGGEDKEENTKDDDLEDSPRITMIDPNGNEVASPTGSETDEERRGSVDSEASEEGSGVNWEELQQTEEKEPRSASSDDVGFPPFYTPFALPSWHSAS